MKVICDKVQGVCSGCEHAKPHTMRHVALEGSMTGDSCLTGFCRKIRGKATCVPYKRKE